MNKNPMEEVPTGVLTPEKKEEKVKECIALINALAKKENEISTLWEKVDKLKNEAKESTNVIANLIYNIEYELNVGEIEKLRTTIKEKLDIDMSSRDNLEEILDKIEEMIEKEKIKNKK